ncbi:kinase-like protein, partial [Auricularia subglabra TFB-10046 SS5]
VLQVAEAVNYLHTVLGLVHGDLKCANVLISDSLDALLGDFGLSTFVEKSESDPTTATGIRDMHTARFAAPELLLGTDDPTMRPRSKTRESDVYAFGMLILEAITELPPWSNQNTLAVIQKVCNGQHPPRPKLDGIFVAISHAWWDISRICWSFEPGGRPSMKTVLNTL